MESTGRVLFFLLVALVCLSGALSSVDEVAKARREEEVSLGKIYSELDNGLKTLVRDNLKKLIRTVQEKSGEINISSSCAGNAFKILSGLRDLEPWAVSFLDATGKPSDGLMSGNIQMLGNYDQCLNISVPKKRGGAGALDFRGRYCLVSYATHVPSPLLTPDIDERVAVVRRLTGNLTEAIRLLALKSTAFARSKSSVGLCVPSGCEANDVDKLMKYAGKRLRLNLTLEYCHTEDTIVYFTPTRIVSLSIYLFFILLVVISSIIEIYSTTKGIKFKNPAVRSLLCFSALSNFRKFTSTDIKEGNLSCLNGIRVLSLFWIILGHHYAMKLSLLMSRNTISMLALTWNRRFFYQILNSTHLAVDVFFFIGGFLNCYMRAKKNFTSFSFLGSIVVTTHRLMRIYPVYISIILFTFLLNPRGPIAYFTESNYLATCKTEWWKNLLFINNMYEIRGQCIGQSWYLAVDMQLFLLSLITIPILFRNLKVGVLTNCAIILLAISVTFARAWIKEIMPTFVVKMDFTRRPLIGFHDVYLSTMAHASSYFGGILLALYVTRKKNLKMSKVMQTFGWIVASAVFLTLVFISKRWNTDVPYTRLEGALYFALSRPLFAWCVGWMMLCCFAGHGGFINSILSWKIWIPLNRLCLSAYLVSVVLQIYFFGNLRSPMDFQQEVEIWGYFGDIAVTCLLSLPIVLMFESPFIALAQVVFPGKEKTPGTQENEMNGKEIVQHEKDAKIEDEKNSTGI